MFLEGIDSSKYDNVMKTMKVIEWSNITIVRQEGSLVVGSNCIQSSRMFGIQSIVGISIILVNWNPLLTYWWI